MTVKKRTRTAPTPEPEYIPAPTEPRDACDEAAAKLNVVIQLLENEKEPAPPPDPDDNGGWGLGIAQDILRQIRDELRASAKGGRS